MLGLKDNEQFLLGERNNGDAATLFARLLQMTDAEVLRVLAFIMAESLPAGSAAVEALGLILGVDMDKWWTADDAFFELLRDKPAINAMMAEIAGKTIASQYIKETARQQKDVIRQFLDGTNGRQKAEQWKPRYFRFPMQAYTKRKGIPAVRKGTRSKNFREKTVTDRAGPRGPAFFSPHHTIGEFTMQLFAEDDLAQPSPSPATRPHA